MNIRLALPVLAGAVLIAGSAFAAAVAPSGTASVGDAVHREMHLAATDRCSALETQWNSVKDMHKNDKKYEEAATYFNHGSALCNGGKTVYGIKTLERALQTIGVNPVS